MRMQATDSLNDADGNYKLTPCWYEVNTFDVLNNPPAGPRKTRNIEISCNDHKKLIFSAHMAELYSTKSRNRRRATKRRQNNPNPHVLNFIWYRRHLLKPNIGWKIHVFVKFSDVLCWLNILPNLRLRYSIALQNVNKSVSTIYIISRMHLSKR